MGSIAPSVSAPAANPTLDPAAAEKAAQQKVNFSDANPVANIQVRLADGSRLIVKLNHNHTVSDLRSYINTARYQSDKMHLVTPPLKVIKSTLRPTRLKVYFIF